VREGTLDVLRVECDRESKVVTARPQRFFEGGTPIGRIYEQRPPAPRAALWVWSIFVTVPGRPRPRKMDGRAATFEDAKAQFAASWEGFRAAGRDSDSGKR
jgi:hypothetical protein